MKKIIQIFLLIAFSLNVYAKDQKTNETYPVVILGSGVSSLTSALYLSRGGVTPLVIEGKNPGGMITKTDLIENWPGEQGISGIDLITKIRLQAINYGCVFSQEEVFGVDFSKKPFVIQTRDVNDSNKIRSIKTNSCIIAMGCSPRKLNINGEGKKDGYFGRGVSLCAVCDGPLYRNKNVAIIGGSDSAIVEASYLSSIAKNVYIFVRKDNLKPTEETKRAEIITQKENVHVVANSQITEIIGDGKKVTHLAVKNIKENSNKKIEIDGVFISIGTKPNTDLFKDKIQLDKNGYVVLSEDQQTSIEGIFAIGDIANPHYKQAICAAGDGGKAAIQVKKYLEQIKEKFLAKNDVKKQIKEEAFDQVIEVKSKEHFNQLIKNTKKFVFVDFYSQRCGPCKTISPLLDKMADTFSNKIKFLKVDVNRNFDLCDQYDIRAMPTLIVFRNGKQTSVKTGSGEIIKLFTDMEENKGKISMLIR
jgi:thioredoxin reductase (NADPH)